MDETYIGGQSNRLRNSNTWGSVVHSSEDIDTDVIHRTRQVGQVQSYAINRCPSS